MKAAGIRRFDGDIEALDLPEPRALRPGEVLIAVRAAGVGDWDEFVRTRGWDPGRARRLRSASRRPGS